MAHAGGQTRLALGNVLLRWDWDWQAAKREIRRAVELDPTSVEARRALADFLFYARSTLSASAGSTRVARRAGIQQARREAAASTPVTAR